VLLNACKIPSALRRRRTGYIDTGLGSGITYYYVVSAINDAGESPNLNQASARPK